MEDQLGIARSSTGNGHGNSGGHHTVRGAGGGEHTVLELIRRGDRAGAGAGGDTALDDKSMMPLWVAGRAAVVDQR